MPHKIVAPNNTQAMWRCSTKKRGVLLASRINCESLLWAIMLPSDLSDLTHRFTVYKLYSPILHDVVAWCDTLLDHDVLAVYLPEHHRPKTCHRIPVFRLDHIDAIAACACCV